MISKYIDNKQIESKRMQRNNDNITVDHVNQSIDYNDYKNKLNYSAINHTNSQDVIPGVNRVWSKAREVGKEIVTMPDRITKISPRQVDTIERNIFSKAMKLNGSNSPFSSYHNQ